MPSSTAMRSPEMCAQASHLWGRGGEGGGSVMQHCGHIVRPPPLTPPHKGEGNAPSMRHHCASNSTKRALGPVDIHLSQIMAPTRNSIDANDSAVFS